MLQVCFCHFSIVKDEAKPIHTTNQRDKKTGTPQATDLSAIDGWKTVCS